VTKGFDHKRTVLDFGMGATRLKAEGDRLAEIKLAAIPPSAMMLAPIAPARGVQQLVPDWEVLPGGTRRQSGAHWITPTSIEVLNAQAVDRARSRDPEAPRSKVELFTPSQVAMARRYLDLVEWRKGSGIRCGKLEASHGGSDPGLYIDRFMDAGAELDTLTDAIGQGIVLSPRRQMDRDNVRRALSVRAAFDGVILNGQTISKVVAAHGWQPKGSVRREVRDAIRGALDRMISTSGRTIDKGA
jgi:hypothetical protein